jgi:hypothetical protein
MHAQLSAMIMLFVAGHELKLQEGACGECSAHTYTQTAAPKHPSRMDRAPLTQLSAAQV